MPTVAYESRRETKLDVMQYQPGMERGPQPADAGTDQQHDDRAADQHNGGDPHSVGEETKIAGADEHTVERKHHAGDRLCKRDVEQQERGKPEHGLVFGEYVGEYRGDGEDDQAEQRAEERSREAARDEVRRVARQEEQAALSEVVTELHALRAEVERLRGP